MYIADTYNYRVRKIIVSTGIITTIAGTVRASGNTGDNGPATSARLIYPCDVTTDASGAIITPLFRWTIYSYSVFVDNVYIVDETRIRKVTVVTGIITCIAGCSGFVGFSGDGDAATSAKLYYPYGVAVDSEGTFFLRIFDEHLILLTLQY